MFFVEVENWDTCDSVTEKTFFFLLFGIVFKCSGKLVVMKDQIAILEKKSLLW